MRLGKPLLQLPIRFSADKLAAEVNALPMSAWMPHPAGFVGNEETVHMAAGECWVFDSFALHEVQNKGSERRIHLVLDTVGGEKLWDLVEDASARTTPAAVRDGTAGNAGRNPLTYEQINRPKVMSPWEMRRHVDYVLDHAPADAQNGQVARRLDRFLSAWHAAWARFGTSDEGLPTYRGLIDDMRGYLKSANAHQIILRNNQGLAFVIDALVLWNAVSPVPAQH